MNWLFLVTLLALSATSALAKGKCSVNNGGCDKKHGKCWETTDEETRAITSYCTCKAGYKPFLGRSGKCVDVNECTSGMHDCDTTHGRCVNTYGGYKCTCNCNYMLDYSHTKCLLASHVTDVCQKVYTKCRGKQFRYDDVSTDLFEQFMPRFFADRSEFMKNHDKRNRGSMLLDILMEMKREQDVSEEEEDEILDEMSPAISYKKLMSNNDIQDKTSTCTCEAGYKKNKCGRCEDINECNSKRTNKCSNTCHNSHGGYYCSCPKNQVVGPCGFKCYTVAKRPKKCTNTIITAAHLSNKELAYADGISESQLLNYISEKSAELGLKHGPLKLTHYGKCTTIGQIVTNTFDLNYDGKTDMTVKVICRKGRTNMWEIYSAQDKEAYWKPWSCWSECKTSCRGGVITRHRSCKNGLGDYGKCTGASTQSKSCYTGPKCQLRVRKSATTLTHTEKKDLIQAMIKYKKDLYSTYGFHAAAGTHQWPNQCTSQANGMAMPCCHHGARLNFVMWHRAELKNFELGLTRYLKDKKLGLPYWDWIKSLDPPTLLWSKTLYGKANPFSGMTVRLDQTVIAHTVRDINFNKSPTGGGAAVSYFNNEVTKVMKSNMLHIMSESIENAHNFIHAGCCGNFPQCIVSMGNLQYAAFDPMFFFHHSNVDRIFAMYQNEALKNKEFKWSRQAALEPQQIIYDFNKPYAPFHDKSLTPWISMRSLASMEDLYYYKGLLGYEYDTLAAHGHKVLTGTIYKEDHSPDEENVDEIETKAHFAQGTDQMNIISYQRSLGKNVVIRYFYAGIGSTKQNIDCKTASDSSGAYMGRLMILGSKGERAWQNPQPTVLDVTSYFGKNWISIKSDDYNIKACYTEQLKCTAGCTVSSLPILKKLPSPQMAYYPRNTVVDIYKFKWQTGEIFPTWQINVRSGKEWVKFEGAEKNNIVQVKTLAAYNSCNASGATAVTCDKAPCLLPRGSHYFIHKSKSSCGKGLKLRVLARF